MGIDRYLGQSFVNFVYNSRLDTNTLSLAKYLYWKGKRLPSVTNMAKFWLINAIVISNDPHQLRLLTLPKTVPISKSPYDIHAPISIIFKWIVNKLVIICLFEDRWWTVGLLGHSTFVTHHCSTTFTQFTSNSRFIIAILVLLYRLRLNCCSASESIAK